MKIIITESQYSLLIEERKNHEERYNIPDMSTVLVELQDSGEVPKSLKVDKYRMFDEYREMEEISNELHDILQETPGGIPRDKLMYVVNKTDRLIKFGKMINYPIHLNIFKNKNGTEFIQARSSIVTDEGRIMVNAYIGSTDVYKGGVDDEEANMRGRKALYKKMRKHFIDE